MKKEKSWQRQRGGRARRTNGSAAGEVSGKMDCSARRGKDVARAVWEKLWDKKVMSADTICPYSQDSRLAFGLRGKERGDGEEIGFSCIRDSKELAFCWAQQNAARLNYNILTRLCRLLKIQPNQPRDLFCETGIGHNARQPTDSNASSPV